MSMEAQPGDIFSIAGIFLVVGLCRRIEYVDRESELVFTIPRWRTECVGTLSEIPHPLLVARTSIPTDDDEGSREIFLEISRHLPESISRLAPEIDRPSCLTHARRSTHALEVIWSVVSISEWDIPTDKCIDIRIIFFSLRSEYWYCFFEDFFSFFRYITKRSLPREAYHRCEGEREEKH